MDQKMLSKLVSDLSWNNSVEAQENAFIKLQSLNTDSLKELILPPDKSCWENAARIIEKYDLNQIEEIASLLLEWLKDINWPGSKIILDLLSRLDKELFQIQFEDALQEAYKDKDEEWLYSLKLLYIKARFNDLKFKNISTLSIIEGIET